MTEGPTVVSHLIGVAIGISIRDFLGVFTSNQVCPPCEVTCGSLACPAVHCTTGHIEFSIFTWLVTGVLLILIGLVYWWCCRRAFLLSRPTGDSVAVKPLTADVRRPLGTATSWRPEGR